MYISPSTLKEIHRRCSGKYPSDEESMNKWIESIIEMNTTAEPEKIYFLRDLDYLVDELHISNYKDNVGSIVRGWMEGKFVLYTSKTEAMENSNLVRKLVGLKPYYTINYLN